MFKATWEWYYGSNEEELLADCKFGEPYETKTDLQNFVVRPGIFSNGDSVNIFTFVGQKSISIDSPSLENCAKYIKLLRHPNILRYVGCVPVEAEYHFFTEHAYPLCTVINHVDAHEICNGLHDIALALQFIHDKAYTTHNNVCMETIYVSNNGPWKLGGFEYACHFDAATKEWLTENPNYIVPPEECAPQTNKVALPMTAEHAYCRDVYCFGLLLEHFLEQLTFSTRQSKKNIKEIIEDLMREDYKNRPTMKEVLTMSVFKSNYISIVHFLQSVTLKTKEEKDIFFKSLLSDIETNHIFAEVVGRRIVPLLLTPIVMAEQCAVEHVLKIILIPVTKSSTSVGKGGILPESVFARYVIPKIVELFQSRLLHVRLVLIDNFAKYVHLFEKSVLNDVVLPEVLLGLNDCNNQLVRGSLHALAEAVTIVGGDVIVGAEREKIFVPSIPKFDGRALNEIRSLAYEPQKPARKKVEKVQQQINLPRKSTLLELAMKRQTAVPVGNTEKSIILKQKQLAHALQEESASMSNGNVATNRKDVCAVDVHQVMKNSHSSSVFKKKEPDIETWASSDEDVNGDTRWPDFSDNNSDEELNPPTSNLHYIPETISISLKQPLNKNVSNLPTNHPKTNAVVQNGESTIVTSIVGDHLVKQLQLGEEFEIKVNSDTFKTPITEPDFFADMVPEIDVSSSMLSATNDTNTTTLVKDKIPTSVDTSVSVDSEQSSLISSNFAAVGDENEEDGWDNDDIAWE